MGKWEYGILNVNVLIAASKNECNHDLSNVLSWKVILKRNNNNWLPQLQETKKKQPHW